MIVRRDAKGADLGRRRVQGVGVGGVAGLGEQVPLVLQRLRNMVVHRGRGRLPRRLILHRRLLHRRPWSWLRRRRTAVGLGLARARLLPVVPALDAHRLWIRLRIALAHLVALLRGPKITAPCRSAPAPPVQKRHINLIFMGEFQWDFAAPRHRP